VWIFLTRNFIEFPFDSKSIRRSNITVCVYVLYNKKQIVTIKALDAINRSCRVGENSVQNISIWSGTSLSSTRLLERGRLWLSGEPVIAPILALSAHTFMKQLYLQEGDNLQYDIMQQNFFKSCINTQLQIKCQLFEKVQHIPNLN
jgi:hypothetical protein